MKAVRCRYRIIYGDTDTMGQAYYGNYLRWFEMGRNEWMRDIGTTYAQVEEGGVYAPVTQAYCHYFSPARYDEWIVIETDVEYIKRASIKFVYRVLKEDEETKLAAGYTVHGFVNGDGKVVKTPAKLMESIRALESA